MNYQDVCAVVVTFNRKHLLMECIESLLIQSHALSRIIIIDNASTDGTDIVVQAQYGGNPVIYYRQLPINTGGAGGFHEGIKTASDFGHAFIWVMDDDAAPDSICLSTLLPVFNTGEDVIAVAPKVVGLDGGIQSLHRGWISQRLIPEIQKPVPEHRYNSGIPCSIETASFVGLLFKASCINSIGLPESRMFIYNDDIEFCLRMRNFGIILLVPNAIIYHKDKPRVYHKSILGIAHVQVIPIERYGLIYLNRRNLVWTIKKHLGAEIDVLFKIFLGLAFESIKIILFMDRKVSRLRCIWMAFTDGFGGALGPIPEKIKVLLK